MKVNVHDDSISIDQSKYAKEIIEKCGYENAHASGTVWRQTYTCDVLRMMMK